MWAGGGHNENQVGQRLGLSLGLVRLNQGIWEDIMEDGEGVPGEVGQDSQ